MYSGVWCSVGSFMITRKWRRKTSDKRPHSSQTQREGGTYRINLDRWTIFWRRDTVTFLKRSTLCPRMCVTASRCGWQKNWSPRIYSVTRDGMKPYKKTGLFLANGMWQGHRSNLIRWAGRFNLEDVMFVISKRDIETNKTEARTNLKDLRTIQVSYRIESHWQSDVNSLLHRSGTSKPTKRRQERTWKIYVRFR